MIESMEAMNRHFESEEIISLARLEELLPEWKALWTSARCSTPFQFPGWNDALASQAAGMRGMWLDRRRTRRPAAVPVVSSLTELCAKL